MKNTLNKISVVVLLLLCLPMLITAEVSGQSPITTQQSDTGITTTTNTNSKTVSVQSTSVQSTSAQSEPKLNTVTGTGSWQELGPTPITNPNNNGAWGSAPYSGRVTAIAVNGSNSQEIYVGAAAGGVWKTLDGGTTWTPLMDTQSSLAVGAIALSPDNSTIYVGTGEANHNLDGYYGMGLLKSTDEGKTWTILGANYFSESAISAIIINRANPNNILVSTTSAIFAKGLSGPVSNSNGVGVFQSTDGGATWSKTLDTGKGITNGVASMVANATDPSIVFAGDFNGTIWSSGDGGSTWSIYIYSTNSAGEGRVALAVTPDNPAYLYALTENTSGGIYNMYVYDASSGNFYSMNTSLPVNTTNNFQYGPCGGQCWYNLIISVSPIDVNTIYVGTNNLYKSIDGGQTWTFLGGAQWNGNLHPDQHALVFSPNNPSTIYSGNDGGIYKSTDGGSTWTSLNTNLGITQFDSISASPTNDSHLLGGVQDNACNIYTNSTGWAFAASGDGAASAFINDTFMACNYIQVAPRFSLDNGKTFFQYTTGMTTTDPVQFDAPMTQDPSNPAILYFGTNRIYKINVDSTSVSKWTDISGIIATGTNGYITSIAVSKSNSQVMYEGDNQGVVKDSIDGGANWNTIFSASSSLGITAAVTSVAVDPMVPSFVIVSFALQNNADKIIFSNDQGTNWYATNEPTLNGIATNVIKINPLSDIPYMGTDNGVYYLNGTDATWYKVGTGLPNVPVYDLAFTASNYLVAGTHGRGAWLNYITPFITSNSFTNSSYLRSGTSVSFSITDSNGLGNVGYYWDSNSLTVTTGSFSTTTPIGDGQHVLHVLSQDLYGNWRNETFVVNVDDSIPTITIPSTFVNGTQTKSNNLDVIITDSSPFKDIVYNWNGTTNSTATLTNSQIAISFPSGSGLYYLHLYAEDSANNWASKTYAFIVDNSVPVMRLPSTFTNTTLVSGSTLNFSISNSVSFKTIQYNWNGTTNSTLTVTNGKVSVTLPTGSGIEYLHVYIQDSYAKWTTLTFAFKIQPKQTTTPTTTPTSSSSNTPTKSKSSPGFEAIALLGALGIVFLLRKRNR